MAERRSGAGGVPRWSPVRMVGTAVGALFLLIGVFGFFPDATTRYDALQLVGFDSGAKLLGVFPVSVLFNVVNILFGLAGLAMSRTVVGARMYLVGGGAIYLALWVYGRSADESRPTFLPRGDADDWLHVGLGSAMVLLGLVVARGRAPRLEGAGTRAGE